MEFCPFAEIFPEIASWETRNITFFTPTPGGPPLGKYFFMEMFCTNPKCDCHNAMIAIYREEPDQKFQEITRLRYCWKSNAFYERIGIYFNCNDLPGIFPDINQRGSPFDTFFIQKFGAQCYLNFDEKNSSLRTKTDYAKRIEKHYRLFKDELRNR